jgi:hypothetical protein
MKNLTPCFILVILLNLFHEKVSLNRVKLVPLRSDRQFIAANKNGKFQRHSFIMRSRDWRMNFVEDPDDHVNLCKILAIYKVNSEKLLVLRKKKNDRFREIQLNDSILRLYPQSPIKLEMITANTKDECNILAKANNLSIIQFPKIYDQYQNFLSKRKINFDSNFQNTSIVMNVTKFNISQASYGSLHQHVFEKNKYYLNELMKIKENLIKEENIQEFTNEIKEYRDEQYDHTFNFINEIRNFCKKSKHMLFTGKSDSQ